MELMRQRREEQRQKMQAKQKLGIILYHQSSSFVMLCMCVVCVVCSCRKGPG